MKKPMNAKQKHRWQLIGDHFKIREIKEHILCCRCHLYYCIKEAYMPLTLWSNYRKMTTETFRSAMRIYVLQFTYLTSDHQIYYWHFQFRFLHVCFHSFQVFIRINWKDQFAQNNKSHRCALHSILRHSRHSNACQNFGRISRETSGKMPWSRWPKKPGAAVVVVVVVFVIEYNISR